MQSYSITLPQVNTFPGVDLEFCQSFSVRLHWDICFVMIVIRSADPTPFIYSKLFFLLQDIQHSTGDVVCVCEYMYVCESLLEWQMANE